MWATTTRQVGIETGSKTGQLRRALKIRHMKALHDIEHLFLSVVLETLVSPAQAELDLVAIHMLRKPLLLQWEVKWQLVANDDINKDRLRASHLFLAASSHFNANRENRANEGWMMGSQEELYDEAAWKERPAGPSEEENIVAFIFVEDLASPKAG
ncbi:hypothetical protein EDD22DRAFT_1054402, partial [Suillus occidentalis]